jgi:hypothetical protein
MLEEMREDIDIFADSQRRRLVCESPIYVHHEQGLSEKMYMLR